MYLALIFGSLRRSLGIVRFRVSADAAACINQDDLSATPVSQSLTVNHCSYKIHIPNSHLTFCNAEQDLIRYPSGDGGAWRMARACRLYTLLMRLVRHSTTTALDGNN
jgi:hypothetical protein